MRDRDVSAAAVLLPVLAVPVVLVAAYLAVSSRGYLAVALAALVALGGIYGSADRERGAAFACCASIAILLVVPSTVLEGRYKWMPEVAAALLMVAGLLRYPGTPRMPRGLWPLLVLLLVPLAHSNGARLTVVIGRLAVVVAALGAYVLVANFDTVARRRLITFIVWAALVETALGAYVVYGSGSQLSTFTSHISSAFRSDVGTKNELLTGHIRAEGTFAHPLPMSFLLLIAVGFLAAGLKWRGPRRFLAIGVLVFGLFLTGTRSTTPLGIVLAVFLVGRNRGTAYARGALLVVAGAVAAYAFNLGNVAAIQSLSGSGDVSHRQAAYQAFTPLFQQRSTLEVILGNGYGSIVNLFDQGLLQHDGFTTIDNEFVTAFAIAGAVGLAALLWWLVTLLRRPGAVLPLLLASVAMFLVFDVLSWDSVEILWIVMAAFAVSPDIPLAAPVALGDSDDEPISATRRLVRA